MLGGGCLIAARTARTSRAGQASRHRSRRRADEHRERDGEAQNEPGNRPLATHAPSYRWLATIAQSSNVPHLPRSRECEPVSILYDACLNAALTLRNASCKDLRAQVPWLQPPVAQGCSEKRPGTRPRYLMRAAMPRRRRAVSSTPMPSMSHPPQSIMRRTLWS